MTKIVKDPFGNEVAIQQAVFEFARQLIQSEDVLDDIHKVIERPAMIFKMKEGCLQLFYFRAIGWNRTMLIEVQKTNQHFEVVNYEVDPPLPRLAELNLKGERLI